MFDIVRPKGDVPSIATPRPGLRFPRLFQLWISCVFGPFKSDCISTMENPAPSNSADETVKDNRSAGDTTDTSPPPPSMVVAGEKSIAVIGSVPVTLLDGVGMIVSP